jgi:serine/threonine protein kinase
VDLVDALAFEGRVADFSIKHVDKIIQQVERGLDSLHAHGLRHNDLRACNVLVFEFDIDPSRVRVKLGDLEDCAPGPRESTAALRAELLNLQ